MAGLNVFIAPESASHRDLCWSNQLGGSSALTNYTPRRLGNVAYVEKINIRMRRWKRVAEKIKIKMRRKRRAAAKTNTRMRRWREDQLRKKIAHRPIVILTLYCVRRLHMQLKQVDVFLERSEAKGLEERVFYLLFLLMFICYLPARTCFYLLFFLLVICSLPFYFPFCYWLFAICLDERVELGGVGLQVLPDHLGQTVGRVIAHLRDSHRYNSVCRKQSAGSLWFLRSKGSLFAHVSLPACIALCLEVLFNSSPKLWRIEGRKGKKRAWLYVKFCVSYQLVLQIGTESETESKW